MILAHHQITPRIHSWGNHNSSTPRFRCMRQSMNEVPARIHSCRWTRKPLQWAMWRRACRRPPPFAQGCTPRRRPTRSRSLVSHRSSTARFFLLGFDGLRRRLNPPARMTARPTTSMCLATDSPLPPPVSASTHESPRCSSRTTDIVWPNTLSLPDFCRVYYDPGWYNGPRCSGQNTPIR
jgi:hypothetical protein